MGNKVQGKNIGGYLLISGTYYPIFCGKTLRFNRKWDEIETTNINSGGDRDYEAGMGSATMEVTGVTVLDNSENRVSINYLMQLGSARQKRDWKITMTDDDGDLVVHTFTGIIVDASFDKTIPGYSTSYLTVRICGAVTQTTVQPTGAAYEILSDYWDTVNGQTYISGASSGEYDGTNYTLSATTDTILMVDLEGTGYDLVSGTPTIGERECYFNTSPVRVQFPTDIIFDGTQRVFVMWKRVI